MTMNRTLCAVLAAGLLSAGPLAGRVRAGESDKAGGWRAEHAEHSEKLMKERLGLTEEQASKLKAAREAEKAAVKPLREQAKETSRKLEEQVRALASDKDISATLDQLDANRKAMIAERQKLESALASILKPSQRAKMRLLMAERFKRVRSRRGAAKSCGGASMKRRGND
jgi:Spy/CpxP family protein refolding chaperone